MKFSGFVSLVCLITLLFVAPMAVLADEAFVFDDFEAETLDTNKWSTEGNVGIENGTMILKGNSTAHLKSLPYQTETYVDVSIDENTGEEGDNFSFSFTTKTPDNQCITIGNDMSYGNPEGNLHTQWVKDCEWDNEEKKVHTDLGQIDWGEKINFGLKYTTDGNVLIIKNGEVIHTHTNIPGVDKALSGDYTYFGFGTWSNNETNSETVVATIEDVKVQQSSTMPKYSIQFWQLMNRRNEEGNREFARLLFGVKDMEGSYVLENPFASVKVFDPDGLEIAPSVFNFNAYASIGGSYDGNNGNWSFDEDFGTESFFIINFPLPLKKGDYKIVLEDKDGIVYESTKTVSGEVAYQPMISSETFKSFKNETGDFYMKWEVPDGIDRGVGTSVRSWLSAYQDDKLVAEIFVKIPTDLGFMIIPDNVLDKITPLGSVFKLGLHLRTHDGTFRAYSKEVILDENFSFTGSAVDVNTGECPVSSYPSIDDSTTLDIYIPTINVQGTLTPVGVTLEKYLMESDPLGFYWKLSQ